MRPPTRSIPSLERILVDFVEPSAEERRAPLRRLVGETVSVHVNTACDGDAVLGACICYRVPGEPRWRFAPLRASDAPGRWQGDLRLQSGGRYRVSVEAWVDVYATLRARLMRALEAGDDAEGPRQAMHDMLMGRAERADGADRELLHARAAALRVDPMDVDRVQRACDRALARRMWVLGERLDMVRASESFEVDVDRRRAGFAAWWIGAPPREARAQGETSMRTLARWGIDVVCVDGPETLVTLVDAPASRPAARVAGARGDAAFERAVEQARRLGVEVALDFDPVADRPAARAARTHTSPSLWRGERTETWQAARTRLERRVAQGVRTFRVRDPAHQPLPFWFWLLGTLKRAHPDVVCVASGDATPLQETFLARAGLSAVWPLESRNESAPTADWLRELAEPKRAQLLRPHLQVDLSASEAVREADVHTLRRRVLLATMLSPACAFHARTPLLPVLQRDLHTLLRLRRENRALQLNDNVRLRGTDNEQILFFTRSLPQARNDVLVLVNLDSRTAQEGRIDLPLDDWRLSPTSSYAVEDLLTGEQSTWSGARRSVRLDPRGGPGAVLRLVRRRRLGALL